jgi:ABC-type lipoprotein release transport system permease subunit
MSEKLSRAPTVGNGARATYGESAHDPVVFIAVAVVLKIVAAAANTMPALRAVRVNPSVALHTE